MKARLETLIDPFARSSGPPPRTLMAFLHWCLKGSLGVIAAGGVISATLGVAEILAAGILGAVIDAAIAAPTGFFAENWPLLLGAAAFFVVLRPVLAGASGLVQSVVVGPAVINLVLSRLHRYSMGQAVTFFDNDFAGRISQKQMQAARAVSELTIDTIQTVFFALASLVAAIALLGGIEGIAALALALWAGAYIALVAFFMPRIRVRSKARAASRAMVTGQVVDTITNIKTVKLFAHSDHEDAAAVEAMAHYRGKALDFGWVSASFRLWLMTLAGALPVVLLGATLWLWTQGATTAGDIAVAGTVALRLAQMTGWVSFTLLGMYSNVGEVEDAIHTLTPPYTLADKPDAATLTADGPVAFEGVTFAYGREEGGIREIDLTIATGEKLGIVGASGAGKSTLVAALLRLYDVEEGRIAIGGTDIRDVTQESLRRRIGMVTQETAMFNRSALDNIRYGNPNATEADVVAAAQRAEAHDFILTLRDYKGRTGYAAHLGERGVKLSGGQRQRIALARAFLKDAPILILDEATSALDSEVEASIQSALERVMEDKTVIAIAHRLSTIARMDRIVVMEDGRIVEQGSHRDLLASEGTYARYWNRQSGGFIGVEEMAAE